MKDDSINILFITDIHQNIEAVGKIEFEAYDLILCGGDFLDLAEPDINIVKGIIDLLPPETYVVPGNCDKDERVIDYLKEKLNFIHMKKISAGNIPLLGIGYCRNLWLDLLLYRKHFICDKKRILDFHKYNKLNFLLKFSGINIAGDGDIEILDENSAYEISRDFIDKFVYFGEDEIKKLFDGIDTLAGGVVLTHSPPLDTLDKLDDLPNVGSKDLADGIIKTGPAVVLCGHFHELISTAKINGSVVFNPGALKDNRYGEIRISPGNNIETIFKTI